jgi:hypothetical protein
MKFVKSKKSNVGDAWRQMHVTIVDLIGYRIETFGKPAVPEDIAWVKTNEVELLKAFLKSWGVDKYDIVFYQEDPRRFPIIDKLEELFEKYPECEEIDSVAEQLACLERKTGKKYVLLFLDLGSYAVAEIL